MADIEKIKKMLQLHIQELESNLAEQRELLQDLQDHEDEDYPEDDDLQLRASAECLIYALKREINFLETILRLHENG